MKKTKLKLIPGAPVRTNETFSARFFMGPWRGVLICEHNTIAGSWWVNVTSPRGLRHQVINEKYLEAEA